VSSAVAIQEPIATISSRREPEGLEFRLASEADIDSLVDIGAEFFAESSYPSFGLEFSHGALSRYLHYVLDNYLSPHVLAEVNGELVGFVSWTMDATFSDKPAAILQQIFVRHEFRRSNIGRLLMAYAREAARNDGAACFIAPINSGHENTASLRNMLAKSGLRESGFIMSGEL